MRACAVFSKLGLGFLHNFQEATFKKPTFCDSCNGFVSAQPPPPTARLGSPKQDREGEGGLSPEDFCSKSLQCNSLGST